ncbi:unnamed protein product [Amoebophrya sp. A120]|nr:unnamed protein product [Amoebophrya sp. A120]|eukprot:GSA120T00014039001.1
MCISNKEKANRPEREERVSYVEQSRGGYGWNTDRPDGADPSTHQAARIFADDVAFRTGDAHLAVSPGHSARACRRTSSAAHRRREALYRGRRRLLFLFRPATRRRFWGARTRCAEGSKK